MYSEMREALDLGDGLLKNQLLKTYAELETKMRGKLEKH